MTFDELFKKYPGLEDARKAGVEFYAYIQPDENGNDLEAITSIDFNPGDRWKSDEEGPRLEELISKGYVCAVFPYHARSIDFESVEDIDKHLIENKGKFKLPGYSYN